MNSSRKQLQVKGPITAFAVGQNNSICCAATPGLINFYSNIGGFKGGTALPRTVLQYEQPYAITKLIFHQNEEIIYSLRNNQIQQWNYSNSLRPLSNYYQSPANTLLNDFIFSGNELNLIFASYNNNSKVGIIAWDSRIGKKVVSNIPVSGSTCTQLAANNNTSSLAVLVDSKKIHLFDIRKYQNSNYNTPPMSSIESTDNIVSYTFNALGDSVIYATYTGRIEAWELYNNLNLSNKLTDPSNESNFGINKSFSYESCFDYTPGSSCHFLEDTPFRPGALVCTSSVVIDSTFTDRDGSNINSSVSAKPLLTHTLQYLPFDNQPSEKGHNYDRLAIINLHTYDDSDRILDITWGSLLRGRGSEVSSSNVPQIAFFTRTVTPYVWRIPRRIAVLAMP